MASEVVVIDGAHEPTAGEDDRMETDSPARQKEVIDLEPTATNAKVEKIEVEAPGTEELGNVVAEDTKVDTTQAKPEKNEDEDLEMTLQVDMQEVDDAVASNGQTESEAIKIESDPSTDADTTEPSVKDQMDIDPPEDEQEKVEEGDVEEVEYTASATWSLPRIVDDGNKPKLSLKQLVIMALVMSPTRSMSVEEICMWINNGFQYYKDQTFQHTLTTASFNWMEELNVILHQYDFPTEPIENSNAENKNLMFHLPPGREWHILPKPEKMKAKPFRFVDLPFDIRLMVLELVLCRPLPKKHGWIINPEYTSKRKDNYRKANRMPQRLTGKGPHGWRLHTDRLDKVLAILSVSKQVYEEAAPVFYRTNFFEFDSAVTLSRFLDGVPFRRKWIRNIVLHYDPAIHGHSCSRAFNLLKETKLRNFHLFLNEDKLVKHHELTRFSDPISRLPGMKVLVEVRGLSQVAIHGPCTQTTKFLCKITDYKKNDSKDDDELIAMKRNKEQEKYQAALKRSWKDLKTLHDKRAADALKKRQAREREEAKRKREEDRKAKAEEAKEVKRLKQEEREKKKAEAASTLASRQRDKKDKAKIKQIKATMKNKGKREDTPADESSSDEPSSSSSDSSKEESEPEEVPPPPPKRRKTIPATKSIADAKLKTGPKIPFKPAPASKPLIIKSATGTHTVVTKSGIKAKGSSFSKNLGAQIEAATAKPAARGKRSVIVPPVKTKKSCTGNAKKPATRGVKRKSDVASVFERTAVGEEGGDEEFFDAEESQ
jgi:hypothetical protein